MKRNIKTRLELSEDRKRLVFKFDMPVTEVSYDIDGVAKLVTSLLNWLRVMTR